MNKELKGHYWQNETKCTQLWEDSFNRRQYGTPGISTVSQYVSTFPLKAVPTERQRFFFNIYIYIMLFLIFENKKEKKKQKSFYKSSACIIFLQYFDNKF